MGAQEAFKAARRVSRKIGPELDFALYFLPPARRDAVAALGAFLWLIREAIAEEECGSQSGGGCCSGGGAETRIGMIQQRLDGLYRGEWCDAGGDDERAVAAAGMTIQKYQIPRAHFEDWIEGRRMELTLRRYATWAGLERYLARTGGTASLIIAGALGVTDSSAGNAVAAMGKAVALTRVLLRVGADRERGVVYLPQEDLVRARCPEREIGTQSPGFAELMRLERKRARRLFEEGKQSLGKLAGDGSRLFAAMICAGAERRLLGRRGGRIRDLVAAWRMVQRMNRT